MLYKFFFNDLMTFVDIILYLIFIVWLRFVNHLLNYYLLILTYLLTYFIVTRFLRPLISADL